MELAASIDVIFNSELNLRFENRFHRFYFYYMRDIKVSLFYMPLKRQVSLKFELSETAS